MRALGGAEFRLAVSDANWGYRYPTPWWIRIWQTSPETAAGIRALESDPGISCIAENQDGPIEIGVHPPFGVESGAVLAELVRVTGRLARHYPRSTTQLLHQARSPTASSQPKAPVAPADEIEPP
jgi:hypothetical protein